VLQRKKKSERRKDRFKRIGDKVDTLTGTKEKKGWDGLQIPNIYRESYREKKMTRKNSKRASKLLTWGWEVNHVKTGKTKRGKKKRREGRTVADESSPYKGLKKSNKEEQSIPNYKK